MKQLLTGKKKTMKYKKHIREFTSAILFLCIFSFSLNAQWNIPNDAANKKSPFTATYETLKKGKDFYHDNAINCASCHGDPGMGNNNAAIKAPDLGSLDFQNQNTPGTVFFKISEGMGAMPSFKARLSEEEIWNVVHYIKSFDQNFVVSGEKVQSYKGDISLEKNNETRTVTATISVKDNNNNEVSSEGAIVTFYVKRIFGNLPLGDAEVKSTDGKTTFTFPGDIPGNEEGNVTLIAAFKDQDLYGNASVSTELNWGKHTQYVDTTNDRTLWGFGRKVPLWLLFTYLFTVGGVWSGIIYVVFKLTRLKKAGK